ncbi:MAG TPA: maleylpyruvate isomerase N-terminal domain-containing protein [Acidimicrobiia bacterium]|nr:maleylpyruvate isomerase N-terminal domain-containing protein [Acidimicrobiia bacterium]
MDHEGLEPFFEACELASRVMNDHAVAHSWGDPSALDGFTVGGIAAHLYAATRRFEVALDEDVAERPQVVDLPAFYGLNRVNDPGELTAGWHPLLREDAERRAAHGPEAVAERFGAVVARLQNRLRAESPERLIPVWTIADGATPLRVYVATRVVELVVHADDLAVSVNLEALAIPRSAALVVLDVFVEMARHRSGDLDVIRAFARRERAGEDALRVL